MNKARLFISLSLFTFLCHICQGQLKLTVTGLSHQESKLFIAVFDNASEFLTDKIFYSKKIDISGEVAVIEINDLPYGTYAISVYQDLNANEKLDKKLFGVPSEPYGFSKSAPKFARPPTFSEASFQYMNQMELSIRLTLR